MQTIARCRGCFRAYARFYSAVPQYHAPSASESASSAAQPLSTPMTPAPKAVKQKKTVKSICAEGIVMKNLNIFKNGTDPVAKAEEEYPAFLWTILNEAKTEKKQTREKNRAVIKRKNFFSGKL